MGSTSAVNPDGTGTKAAAHYQMSVGAGRTAVLRLRLSDAAPKARWRDAVRRDFDQTFEARLREADEFYAALTPPSTSEDAARVMRQALAGMLWTKQYYFFDVDKWLEEHGVRPI